MVTGTWGSTATFGYSGIWNFSTVLTKNKFPGGNLLSVWTVLGQCKVYDYYYIEKKEEPKQLLLRSCLVVSNHYVKSLYGIKMATHSKVAPFFKAAFLRSRFSSTFFLSV